MRNSAGEDLGKIEEIMIDIPTGRVAYAVLSFGGFLGMGNKLFAVPWDAFTVDEDKKQFILNVDKTDARERARVRQGQLAGYGRPDFGKPDLQPLRIHAVLG